MANVRTSHSDDSDFIKHIIDSTVLESAIDFITEKYSAEDLYGKQIMEEWALDNGFVPEDRIQELEDLIDDLKNR